MSTEVVQREHMPLVTCSPWCQYGDGHPGETHVDDQNCISVETHIAATLLVPAPGYEDEEEYVSVCAQTWAAGHRPMEIHLGQGESFGMQFTVGEARRVAAALIAAADLVEGGAR